MKWDASIADIIILAAMYVGLLTGPLMLLYALHRDALRDSKGNHPKTPPEHP